MNLSIYNRILLVFLMILCLNSNVLAKRSLQNLSVTQDTIPDALQPKGTQTGAREANTSIVFSLIPAPAIFFGGFFGSIALFIVGMLLSAGAILLGAVSLKKYKRFLAHPILSAEQKHRHASPKRKAIAGILLGVAGAIIGTIMMILVAQGMLGWA